MAFAMETRPDGRVFFRFAPNHVLPETCASKVIFNSTCAGCGLTRSFIHMAAFRWKASWDIHRSGWAVALLVIGQIPFRLFQLKRIRSGKEPYRAEWIWWISGIVFALLIVHWCLARFNL